MADRKRVKIITIKRNLINAPVVFARFTGNWLGGDTFSIGGIACSKRDYINQLKTYRSWKSVETITAENQFFN